MDGEVKGREEFAVQNCRFEPSFCHSDQVHANCQGLQFIHFVNETPSVEVQAINQVILVPVPSWAGVRVNIDKRFVDRKACDVVAVVAYSLFKIPSFAIRTDHVASLHRFRSSVFFSCDDVHMLFFKAMWFVVGGQDEGGTQIH